MDKERSIEYGAKMQKFTKISSVAAPLERSDFDTDQIYPKQFLRTVKRMGLGDYAFYDLRNDPDGTPRDDFVLDQPQYKGAQILVTGRNFGSGSSREHAVWSMMDLGIRVIIAPSFGDIFFNNCFKNGVLPIQLPQEQVDEIMKSAKEHPEAEIEIDLEKQTITRGNQFTFEFDIDAFSKDCLLNGLDDIGLTLKKSLHIDTFEENMKKERPWV